MSGLLGNIGVRIGLVGVFVVGGFLFRDLLPGGADDLRVGDCFEEPTALETIEEVQHRPCTDEHDNEAVFAGTHPAREGTAPLTATEYEDWVGTNCLPAFQAYTGVDLMTQEALGLGYFVPIDEAWQKGNRKVMSYAYRMDGTRMSASVKTSSR
jgi:hypothetical protein